MDNTKSMSQEIRSAPVVEARADEDDNDDGKEEEDPFGVFDDSDDDDDDYGGGPRVSTTATVPQQREQKQQLIRTNKTNAIEMTRRDNESCGVLAFHTGTEIALLQHVRSENVNNPITNNIDDTFDRVGQVKSIIHHADQVLQSIDRFCYQRHWMMHIGNEKGKVLEQFLSQCLEAKTCLDGSLEQPQQSHSSNFICVELGTYCGYSSIWLARSLLKQFVVKGWDTCQSSSSREEIQLQRRQPTFKIYTVEVVPEHAKIAQEMIRMAKLEDFIEIIIFDPSDYRSVSQVVKNKILETTNISKDSTVLASSTNVAIDFLFIDHDKTRYLADLKQFESSGMIREGSFVAADNVVFAAIDDYRQYVQDLHTKNIVTTRLEESMIEYSEPEIVQSQDGADQQKKIDQLKDGIEMSIYQRDPSSLSSLEQTTTKTPIILTMFPSQIMSGSASKANRTTVRTSEISRKNKRKIQKGGVVSIVAPSPIHSSPSFNQPLWLALVIGILLILHTPAWLVLIHFTDNDTRDDTDGFPILKYLKPGVKMLSVLILDVTPKVASTFLNIYLGGLCLYIGWSKLTKNG